MQEYPETDSNDQLNPSGVRDSPNIPEDERLPGLSEGSPRRTTWHAAQRCRTWLRHLTQENPASSRHLSFAQDFRAHYLRSE